MRIYYCISICCDVAFGRERNGRHSERDTVKKWKRNELFSSRIVSSKASSISFCWMRLLRNKPSLDFETHNTWRWLLVRLVRSVGRTLVHNLLLLRCGRSININTIRIIIIRPSTESLPSYDTNRPRRRTGRDGKGPTAIVPSVVVHKDSICRTTPLCQIRWGHRRRNFQQDDHWLKDYIDSASSVCCMSFIYTGF